jgi:hypothetical protein
MRENASKNAVPRAGVMCMWRNASFMNALISVLRSTPKLWSPAVHQIVVVLFVVGIPISVVNDRRAGKHR